MNFRQLHSDRDSIPEAPAIYFCAPTEENIGRITQDFQNGLYDVYHLNFISPIPRVLLEDLSAAALQAGCVANIHKVFDQYVNFITLEEDMFVLKHQNSDAMSYYAINRANISDVEMDQIMDSIVNCLFSLFVTLGNVPIIRAMKNTSAEVVARELEKKLRENLWDARNNLFHMDATQGGTFSFQRPLLIILDRNIDMATPLHHTWTYQALAHDVLDLALNRVVVEEDSQPHGGARPKGKNACDLNATDKFWRTHKGSPFPTVAEAIQEELEQYRNSEDEIKRLKTSMGIDGENEIAFSMVNDNTEKLTNAVNSLPILMEKKRLIDMHTKIATSILNYIKSRRLDSFFELEEKIMSKQTLDRTLADIFTDTEFGTPEDKMRLFIIYFICTPNVPEAEYSKLEAILQQQGCDMAPMAYIQRWKYVILHWQFIAIEFVDSSPTFFSLQVDYAFDDSATEPIRRRRHQNRFYVLQISIAGLVFRHGGCQELSGETTRKINPLDVSESSCEHYFLSISSLSVELARHQNHRAIDGM